MKHCLSKLVVFLLLGAVVNVAVAWGCALTWAEKPSRFYDAEVTSTHRWIHGYFAVDAPAVGVSRTYFHALGTPEFTSDAPEDALEKRRTTNLVTADFGSEIYNAFRSLEQGEQLFFSNESELNEWDSAIHTWVGWPSFALFGIQRFVWTGRKLRGNPRHLIGAFAVPGGLMGVKHGLALPFRPLWPGIAINTLFYAAILWLLALVPFTARRIIRRKRGQCLKCGYNLRGDLSAGCSECGWRREDVP